jgi:hypothetical protein
MWTLLPDAWPPSKALASRAAGWYTRPDRSNEGTITSNLQSWDAGHQVVFSGTPSANPTHRQPAENQKGSSLQRIGFASGTRIHGKTAVASAARVETSRPRAMLRQRSIQGMRHDA